jgi:hypothetical protein
MATCALSDRAIVLRPEDDVAIAKKELTAGTVLEDGPPTSSPATRSRGAPCAAATPCAATAR